MIIEPCCCHKQLPALCRDNEHRITPFHTNGDVTIEKVFHAIGCLVDNATCTIITPTIDSNCARYLQYTLHRNWITHLNLITAPDNTQASQQNAQASPIVGLVRNGNAVTHITDPRITEASCVFILSGETHRICITGYLPPSSPADTDNRYRLTNHTLLYTNSEPPQSLIWDELTRIPLSPLRIKK